MGVWGGRCGSLGEGRWKSGRGEGEKKLEEPGRGCDAIGKTVSEQLREPGLDSGTTLRGKRIGLCQKQLGYCRRQRRVVARIGEIMLKLGRSGLEQKGNRIRIGCNRKGMSCSGKEEDHTIMEYCNREQREIKGLVGHPETGKIKVLE